MSVSDKEMARRLVTVMSPHLTQVKAAKVARWAAEWSGGSSATNVGIPAAFLEAELERRKLVTGRSALARCRQRWVHPCALLHRNTLRGLVYSERIEDLCTGDLVWDTVVSVEPVGEKECFDFQMANGERPYALVEDCSSTTAGRRIGH